MSITEQIKSVLYGAGLLSPDQPTVADYDDTYAEVSLSPKQKWANAACFIAIFPDRVERRTRYYPVQSFGSFASECYYYNTKEEMVAKIKSWMQPVAAPCWN